MSQLEVLVLITIFLAVFAVLLPSVQSVQATARRTTCGNQLRQLGVALLAFEETKGHFPASDHDPGLFGTWLVGLLPWMDPARDQRLKSLLGEDLLWPTDFDLIQQNGLLRERVPWLHCPADPFEAKGTTSYFGNSGTSYLPHQDDGLFRLSSDWHMDYERLVITRESVTDGTAHTAAIGEGLHAARLSLDWHDQSDHPGRYFWVQPPSGVPDEPFDVWVDRCRSVPAVLPVRTVWRRNDSPGRVWHESGPWGSATYYHALPPNEPSCDFDRFKCVTSGSYHRNGVHSLFADGHLYFVNDDVDLRVWRAWGTRAGDAPLTEF